MVDRQKIIQIFKASPTPTSIVLPDDPKFTFVQVNEAYTKMTQKNTEELIGNSLFESFPENPEEIKPTGVVRLRNSFRKVIAEKKQDKMDVLRYDIKLDDGKFKQIYWEVINTPVIDDDGNVEFIINSATNITEKVLSERANKLMMNNSEDSFILIDKELIIQNFNDNFAQNYKEIFGIKVNKGDSIVEYAQPERRDIVKGIYKRVLKGETIAGEIPAKSKDGTKRYFTIKYKPAEDEQGNIIGSFISLLEKTEEHKAKLELEQNEAKYRNVVEHSTNMFYQHDTEGNLTYVSQQSTEFLGYTPEEAIRDWTDYVTNHPINEKGEAITIKAIETGEPQPPYELQLRKANGDIIWVEVHETPLKNNGEVVGIAGSLTDITERKEYEEQLQKSLERYNYVSKATRDAIYDWDIKKDNLHWGEGFKTLFGHQPGDEKFPIKEWKKLVHPDDLEETYRDLNFTLKDSSTNHWEFEYRLQKSDGSYAYVLENGFIIRDADGEAKRMIGALRDVSESKHVEIQTRLQQNVAKYFKSDETLNPILRKVLEHLALFGKFNTAEIWIKSKKDTHIYLISNYASDKKGQKFYKQSKHIKQFSFGEGLPGTAWKNKAIECWHIEKANEHFTRNEAAFKAGIRSAFGLPLLHNDEVIGVLVFGSEQGLEANKREIYLYEALQTFLGSEIKRKQQEEEMRLLFESATEILAIASPDGRFIRVNPAFCQLMGYSKKELTSQNFENFLHPDDINKTKTEYEETITGERQASHFINRYKTKSGEYRWISWSSSEVIDEDGSVFAYGRDITKTKELEHLLNEVQRMARIGAWEVDLKNEKIYWSTITKEIHEVEPGYNPDLETGINFYKNDGSRKIVRRVLDEARDYGKSWDEELQILTAKGQERWVRVKGEPEIIDGECIRIYGSFQDIHDRKQAEIELEEAFKEKETILESIGDGFFTLDKTWTVTYWNRAAEQLLQTPKQKILNQNLWDVFEDAIDLPSYTNYHRAMHQNITVDFEDYYPALDKWFDISAYPSVEGISVFFKEITARKKNEEEIKRINERFSKVTEATNDAIWDFNIKTGDLFWGKGFETLFGYDLDKIKPNIDFLISLIHPEDRDRVAQNIETYMQDSSKKNWFEEYRFKKNDGTYAYVIDRAIFIKNNQGDVIRVVGAMTDLTKQKEYENSLQELNRKLEAHAKDLALTNEELEQFAYLASHDLQEPLRMVTSFLTQLDKKYSDKLDEKAHEYIHFAVDGAQRMRQIILDLLNYSRLKEDKTKREKVDLNKVLKEVQSLERNHIEETAGEITSQKMPVVMANPTPIKQVFQNLLNNAIKYHKPGVSPKVEVKAEELETHWRFSIRDNGIGINPEFKDTIFQIFQRLHTTDQYSGTGIGLAITKKIVERHGGQIWVDSEEGKGSTFYFTIEK